MRKKLAIPLIIVAFIVGVIAGGCSVSVLWGHLSVGLITGEAAEQTSMDVSYLKMLRANNVTNTVDILETELDGSISDLGFNLSKIQKAKRDPQELKTLLRAKEYREQFPHTNEYSQIDQMVSNAFLLVSNQADK